jgi:hypothetical protein
MRDQTVTIKLTRDEVSVLKKLLIKEASRIDPTFPTDLDYLRQKIHDQI